MFFFGMKYELYNESHKRKISAGVLIITARYVLDRKENLN